MELSEYLSLNAEPLPEWLAEFNQDAAFDSENFFRSRVVYYPGSGYDGQPVKVFGSAHWAHCFMYVDSGVNEADLHRELNDVRYGFAGYSSLYRRPVGLADLMPPGQHPGDLPEQIERFNNTLPIVNHSIGFLEILERNADRDHTHGPSRLAILFLKADGFAIYQALFNQAFETTAPALVVIEDYAFSGNHDKFGGGRLLYRIATQQGVLPPWLFVAENSKAWDGYRRVEDVDGSPGGQYSRMRHLYHLDSRDCKSSDLESHSRRAAAVDKALGQVNRPVHTFHSVLKEKLDLPGTRLFDAYVFVDWSAANRRKQGTNSIWIGTGKFRGQGNFVIDDPINPPTRLEAETTICELLVRYVQSKHRVLVGFDFPYGYPAGWNQAFQVTDGNWTALWDLISTHIQDGPQNQNNRFAVASALNAVVADVPGPFWGRPQGNRNLYEHLSPTRPEHHNNLPPEFREVENNLREQGRQPKSVWQLFYNGSVGSQTLTGLPVLRRLRFHEQLKNYSHVWPFETGWRCPVGNGPLVVHAEIWPGAIPVNENLHEVKDAAQVLSYVHWAASCDRNGTLEARFNPHHQAPDPSVQNCEGWILAD